MTDRLALPVFVDEEIYDVNGVQDADNNDGIRDEAM